MLTAQKFSFGMKKSLLIQPIGKGFPLSTMLTVNKSEGEYIKMALTEHLGIEPNESHYKDVELLSIFGHPESKLITYRGVKLGWINTTMTDKKVVVSYEKIKPKGGCS